MLLAVGGGVYSLASLFSATRVLRHTSNVRVKVADLRASLHEAETGLRGYLVTGEASFLAPYTRAQKEWRAQLGELHALSTDNPEQQSRLKRLEVLVERELGNPDTLREVAGPGEDVARVLPLMTERKRTMDGVRTVLADMEADEARLDAIREREAMRRWVATAGLLILSAVVFLTVFAVFVRQRRAAEARRLRTEEEQRLLKAVFAGIHEGITLLDRSGRLAFANASAARMIGFPSVESLLAASGAEIMQRFEIFDEDGRPVPIEKLPSRAALAGVSPLEPVLIRYRAPGGAWKLSSVEAHPVLDADGRVAQVISVFRDVTAERQADARRTFLLRAVDELSSSLDYEATLASVADLAVPTLADWCAVDIVETAGGPPKRVATAHVDASKLAAVEELQRRYPPDPTSKTGTYEILRTGKAQLMPEIPRDLLLASAKDAEHLRLIEELQLHSYIGVPLSVGGRVLGAITFATSESRRTYDEEDLAFARALADRAALAIDNARLFREVEDARAAATAQLATEQRHRQQAEEQTRFAETFVGMLGHDLRNPLNAILMTTMLLRRIVTSPAGTTAIARIQSSAQRMSNMVGQLLDLTRSRIAGGIPIEKKRVDLGSVIAEVVDELRRAHPGRQITWVRGQEVHAAIDRDRIAQVVSNLLGNALEHGDPAKPVTIVLGLDPGAVRLTVHNEGPAIAPDVLPLLFEPFRQTMTKGEHSKGLGLGLFITERIVAAHGGQVEVSSDVERGTTFAVVLPRREGDAAAPDEQLARGEDKLVS